MKYLFGEQANGWSEAVPIALKEAHKEDMSQETAKLFLTALDQEKLQTETDKSIQSAIHQKYGNKSRWSGPRWFIPMVEPRFDSMPEPKLIFTIQTYLVTALAVQTPDYIYHRTLVGTIGKPEKIILPLIFLKSLLDNDTAERFRIVGRDAVRTARIIPGFKETLWLPNSFITELSDMLLRKSVACWLLDFGAAGDEIAPLVVGTLLGLLFAGSGDPVPIHDQTWDRDTVIQEITFLYGSAVAKDKFQRRAHLLNAGMTNHEAVEVILAEGEYGVGRAIFRG